MLRKPLRQVNTQLCRIGALSGRLATMLECTILLPVGGVSSCNTPPNPSDFSRLSSHSSRGLDIMMDAPINQPNVLWTSQTKEVFGWPIAGSPSTGKGEDDETNLRSSGPPGGLRVLA